MLSVGLRSGEAHRDKRRFAVVAVLICASILCSVTSVMTQETSEQYLLNDSHFHLTNYIQEGIGIRDLLKLMGNKVGRVALFGIPLQQEWSYRVDGDKAPT